MHVVASGVHVRDYRTGNVEHRWTNAQNADLIVYGFFLKEHRVMRANVNVRVVVKPPTTAWGGNDDLCTTVLNFL